MDRRPTAKMNSREPVAVERREPHSIRFTPSEWDALNDSALARGLEPAVFVRMLAMYALRIADAPVIAEASLGIPGQMLGGAPQMLAGARGTRRF
jgi:hypothetical protein